MTFTFGDPGGCHIESSKRRVGGKKRDLLLCADTGQAGVELQQVASTGNGKRSPGPGVGSPDLAAQDSVEKGLHEVGL